VRLLTERRAFAAEIVFTLTVMDKSTESFCRVKYRTEKDRPRAAELDSLVSRGRWVSEGLGKMGVRRPWGLCPGRSGVTQQSDAVDSPTDRFVGVWIPVSGFLGVWIPLDSLTRG
jgi:hypothetical protein